VGAPDGSAGLAATTQRRRPDMPPTRLMYQSNVISDDANEAT
jgi:hypothetical protein